MIAKKIFSVAASIINLFIIILFLPTNLIAQDNNKRFAKDEGILSIMYHRFNESKYPSTNIQMDIFKEHIEIIKKSGFDFYNPRDFINDFDTPKKNKKILITIDDGFESFYSNAWPYLKDNEIPFILFVSTEPVGKSGYMSWEQVKEINNTNFAMIGHHSHTHDYLIDKTDEEFLEDINLANEIFIKQIGYIPKLFSYPFGEYSKFQKDYISQNFNFAFGQHSGVIDVNKEKFELPRFPINENYGKLKRFKNIINTFPLEYKKLNPEQKKINSQNNPPKFSVEFFPNQANLDNINCYSNEKGEWDKSKIKINNNMLTVNFRGAFEPRRGRINCSLNDNGKWRWLGVQFIISKD